MRPGSPCAPPRGARSVPAAPPCRWRSRPEPAPSRGSLLPFAAGGRRPLHPGSSLHLLSPMACQVGAERRPSICLLAHSVKQTALWQDTRAWVFIGQVPGLEQRCPSRLRRLHFGGFLQAVALDGGLAQLVLLDLAARRHRVLLDEVHVEGDLEAGDVLPAILLHVLLGEVGVRLLLYYRGGDLLAVLFVRDAVDLHV